MPSASRRWSRDCSLWASPSLSSPATSSKATRPRRPRPQERSSSPRPKPYDRTPKAVASGSGGTRAVGRSGALPVAVAAAAMSITSMAELRWASLTAPQRAHGQQGRRAGNPGNLGRRGTTGAPRPTPLDVPLPERGDRESGGRNEDGARRRAWDARQCERDRAGGARTCGGGGRISFSVYYHACSDCPGHLSARAPMRIAVECCMEWGREGHEEHMCAGVPAAAPPMRTLPQPSRPYGWQEGCRWSGRSMG
mmetsp:Transcript_51620/g.134060  ORF Transcript_51620/g.134060 Transcript_51620/m.134060 type:complete len:252 (+) Transcript_51620:153-908(+)